MSLALRWGITEGNTNKAGFVFFDAVMAYTQSFKGIVTKHPISLGANITDHFIRDNPVFTLSGVITGVDIGTQNFLIQDLEGNSPYNVFEAPNPVNVKSTDQSTLQKLIPDSVGQFLADTTPEVIVDTGRESYLELIKYYMIEIMSGVIFNDKTFNFDPDIQLVELYDYQGTLLKSISNNLVITSMNFKEDVNSGEALYVDITLERVTFAFLKKTVVPKDVVDKLKKKAASKTDKGKVDSTKQKDDGTSKDAPDDTDPLRQAKDNG